MLKRHTGIAIRPHSLEAALLFGCLGLGLIAWRPHVPAPIRFDDRSSALPFNHASLPFAGEGVSGAAWLDFDRDGDLDLYMTNGRTQPNALFRNDGDGTFTDVAAAAGVVNGLGNSGVVTGDLDNDGYPEIFLTGEGGTAFSDQSPNVLYRNNGNGTFTDITATANLPGAETSLMAAMGDIDRDGYLDIYVTSPGHLDVVPGTGPAQPHANRLYLNNGNLTFTDISASAGVDSSIGGCAVSFTDYDRDGWQDIIVANCNDVDLLPTPFNLYRNNGDLTFTDVAYSAGLGEAGYWMSVSLGDYDNDGHVDIFSTNMGAFFGDGSYRHGLFRNNGNGTYTNVAASVGLATWEFGWGSSFADFNNDGFLDLYIVGALPIPPWNVIGPGSANPGRFFYNNRYGAFTEDSSVTGLDLSSRFTSGLAAADYDNDGFVDAVVKTSSLGPNDPGAAVLLKNRGNRFRSLTVRLVGIVSNRDAVGARIELRGNPASGARGSGGQQLPQRGEPVADFRRSPPPAGEPRGYVAVGTRRALPAAPHGRHRHARGRDRAARAPLTDRGRYLRVAGRSHPFRQRAQRVAPTGKHVPAVADQDDVDVR